mmetsp:Transcript_22473/g.55446  ORF Transcript_22473/g.55446 Transcript_22473/m.55446 type:complete len:146 (-) Transcript_22473:62-499(-)
MHFPPLQDAVALLCTPPHAILMHRHTHSSIRVLSHGPRLLRVRNRHACVTQKSPFDAPATATTQQPQHSSHTTDNPAHFSHPQWRRRRRRARRRYGMGHVSPHHHAPEITSATCPSAAAHGGWRCAREMVEARAHPRRTLRALKL